jgi:RNA polymerase sigma-70 factor (ECF subfamily)
MTGKLSLSSALLVRSSTPDISPEAERELVQGCLRQDRQAQEIFFKRFYAYLVGVSMRYARDEHEAKDFASVALIKAFRNLRQFQQDGMLRAWLHRITVHTCIDEVRKRRRRDERELEAAAELEIAIDASAIQRLQEADLFRLLHQLPEVDRSVFSLYIVDGYSHREIGEMLGFTEGTSRWYLNRAKQRMQELVEKLYHR